MMEAGKTCGTCELLERSATTGLHTWGKCPHRTAWARTTDPGCAHHTGERPKAVVRIAMILNGSLVALSLGTFAWIDFHHGSIYTHVALGTIVAIGLTFLWLVRRLGLFSEEPKYDVLDQADPPPEEERDPRWWLDDR